MKVLIIVFAIIGVLVVGCALIMILLLMISEACRSSSEGIAEEIPTRCILNDEACPYDEDDCFKDCGECEVYEKNKKKKIDLFNSKEE